MSDIDDEKVAADGGADLRPVTQWRAEYFPPTERGAPHRDAWKHAAAAALHNWARYAHDRNRPISLTRQDYEAALVAAQKVGAKGAIEPYAPAYYEVSK